MRCRIQQGANAWGKVEGVMLDRNIWKSWKGKSWELVLHKHALICTWRQWRWQNNSSTWKLVLVLSNNTNKEGWRKKDERPDEICDATKQFNRKIGEKQDEMGRPHDKDGCRHTSKESGRERWRNIKDARKGERTAKIEGLLEVGYEKIGGKWKMERGQPIKKVWKEKKKEWLDNILPEPKKRKSTVSLVKKSYV